MVLCKCFKKLYLSSFYLLEEIGPLPGGLTNCCLSVLDTVGWVIWPVKIVPDMTNNVFGGTLNPTLLLYYFLTFISFGISHFTILVLSNTNRHFTPSLKA